MQRVSNIGELRPAFDTLHVAVVLRSDRTAFVLTRVDLELRDFGLIVVYHGHPLLLVLLVSSRIIHLEGSPVLRTLPVMTTHLVSSEVTRTISQFLSLGGVDATHSLATPGVTTRLRCHHVISDALAADILIPAWAQRRLLLHPVCTCSRRLLLRKLLGTTLWGR